jgi:hypothetical protein
MQHCSVLVARGGDLTNTVLRENVSVPEIGVLIGIHGIDGVLRQPDTTSEKPVKHLDEYDRIHNIYGTDATVAILGQRVFNLNLPTRLSAVFADVVDEPEEEELPKPKRGGIKLSSKADESDELISD